MKLNEEIIYRWFITAAALAAVLFGAQTVTQCYRDVRLAEIEYKKLKAKEGHQFRFGRSRKQADQQ